MRGWLLDTNVVSEPIRPKPDKRVLNWLRVIPKDRTFISILTLAEIGQDVESLDIINDRRERHARFLTRVEAEFSGRVVSLDDETVRLWGALSGRYRQAYGGKAPVVDTLLAATAQRRRLHFATRNTADVRPLGGSAFDPWSDDPRHFPVQL